MPSTLDPTFAPTVLSFFEPTIIFTSPNITNSSNMSLTYAPTLAPTISVANESSSKLDQTVRKIDQTVRYQCGPIVSEKSLPNKALISCMELCIPAKKCLDNTLSKDTVLCHAFESCMSHLTLEDYKLWENQINRLGSTSETRALVAGIALESCSDQSWAYSQGKELCTAVCFDTGCCFPGLATCINDYRDAATPMFCEVFDGCWRVNMPDALCHRCE